MTPSAPQPVLLTATDLWKSFQMGDQTVGVLRGVNLRVLRGQWLAILGASGSGKSTLLHLLGGLDTPSAGAIRFDGQELAALRGGRLDRYRNRHIGFVFQFYHLLPELNVLENVLISTMISRPAWAWPAARREARRHAAALLDRLGLSHRLHHKPAKLSGGERQRVAIARALINQPDVLLADEPTGNLDEDTGRQILEVIRDFHRSGQTVVMVTHDRAIASAADARLTLHAGQLEPSLEHSSAKPEDAPNR
jgi:ABC-type lipoprotein export system ATPase subunit